MKFLTIDLMAYGHFARRSLEFPAEGPNLHISHGPNEAGKSTTLRAITGFLYGIERLTTDAHRFEGSELRVGGRVMHSSGQQRYFVRRKSGGGTLLDAHGNAVDDTQLSDWLSVRDRKLFEAMFGLSHEQLRKAGESLASSKNAAAEALFSAVLEGASLRATMAALQEESAALISPTGRGGELMKAVRGYKDLRDEERKARGSLSKWTLLREEIRAAEERVRDLNEQVRSIRIKSGRLDRIRRTLPWSRRRAEALGARAAMGGVRVLSPDIGERHRALVRERDETLVAREDVASKIERAKRDRAALDVPDALVAFAPRVKGLNEALGTYRKALVDRPGLVHEALPLRRQAEEIMRELGHAETSIGDVESLPLLRHVEFGASGGCGACGSRS